MTYCKSPKRRCDFFFFFECVATSLFFFFSKQAFRDKPSKILFVLKRNTCKRHKERWHSPPIKWGYIFLRPLCKHDKKPSQHIDPVDNWQCVTRQTEKKAEVSVLSFPSVIVPEFPYGIEEKLIPEEGEACWQCSLDKTRR